MADNTMAVLSALLEASWSCGNRNSSNSERGDAAVMPGTAIRIAPGVQRCGWFAGTCNMPLCA